MTGHVLSPISFTSNQMEAADAVQFQSSSRKISLVVAKFLRTV